MVISGKELIDGNYINEVHMNIMMNIDVSNVKENKNEIGGKYGKIICII